MLFCGFFIDNGVLIDDVIDTLDIPFDDFPRRMALIKFFSTVVGF